MKKITIWIAIVSLMSLSACTACKIEDIGTHTVLNEQVNRLEHILEHPDAFQMGFALFLGILAMVIAPDAP